MIQTLKKSVMWILITLAAMLVTGILFEQSCQIYFNSKKPPSDQFCSIDGLNIHYVKKGTGGPTVVFQSGLGGDYKIWDEIQNAVSRQTTTISYDRAGLQWSEKSDKSRTLESMTRELSQLLEKTNCPKPYILVGHSLAGITLRPFIRNNQKDVAAVIFADVSHPLQIKKSSEGLKKYLVTPPGWLISILMETGIVRTYFGIKPFMADLPVSHWMNKHVRDYFYKSYQTFLKEAQDDDPMFEQAEAISSFGTIPVTVISGAYPEGADFLGEKSLADEYLKIHREGQKDLLNLSSISKQVIAPNSGHYVPLQDAEVVINAIAEYLSGTGKALGLNE